MKDDVDRPDLDRSGPLIQSVGRAAAILDALAAGPPEGLALRDLARAVGLARTTTFSLVHSLVAVGLVDQDSLHGHFRLGLGLLALGRRVEERIDLVALARPAMARLCREARETVNLAVPRPMDAFIVDSLEGDRNVRVTAYAATPAAYHSTACGRAILAHLPAARIESVLNAAPFERLTPRTETDPDRLRAILAACRRDGFVLERAENEEDAACIGAPVFDPAGTLIGSISIAAPEQRMTDDAIARFRTLLARAAAEIRATIAQGAA